ncbi:MAG: hypothetical protein LUC97_07605 [Clostridiales bacterium]|nr:hypothetical protein [Clostridiales bacterium]
MKKFLSFILCVIISLSCGVRAFAEQEITIYVNGSIVESEVKPVIYESNTLIPIRPVAEAMGCEVTWFAEEQGIRIQAANITVAMIINDNIIYSMVNERKVTLTVKQYSDIAPMIAEERAYIPMRAMVEALGGEVSWDGETKTAYVTYDDSTIRAFYDENELEYDNTNDSGELITDSDGTGFVHYENGGYYVGEMKDGLRHGWGAMTFDDGDVYEGGWENDIMHGIGTYTYENGTVYEGHFKNNQKSGQGKITYADGAVYEGEWKNDKMNGTGIYTYADGTVISGTWENGEFVG